MSHDPLEGERPPDMADPPEMRPHDALDRPAVAQPGGSSTAKIAILIVILCALVGAGAAFYLTVGRPSSGPRPTPTTRPSDAPTAQPSGAPTAQPSGSPADESVRQGAAPSATK